MLNDCIVAIAVWVLCRHGHLFRCADVGARVVVHCYLGFVKEILHDRHEHNKTMTAATNVIIRGQWVAIIHDHEI